MRIALVRAVVFDLDDTLYRERDYTHSAVRAVAAFLEQTLESRGALQELLALEDQDPAGPLYSRWLSLRGLEERFWLPRLLDVHRGHRPRLALDDEVRSLLLRMRATRCLGLVTDGRLAQQRSKAEALGLPELLDALTFSDALGRERWKPHPAPFREVLERLRVPASEAVYVGDNPAKDFLGARRAGLRSIRLRRTDGLHATDEPDCAEAAPDAEIQALSELEGLLS